MEIKQTKLPPFGGPREESGANGSLWSMGGGIIGSPGAEQPPAEQLFFRGADFTTGTLQGAASADDGKIFIGLPNTALKNSLLDGSQWQIRVNGLSTTYPVLASLNASDLVLTPQAPVSGEFISTITGNTWTVNEITINSVTRIISIVAAGAPPPAEGFVSADATLTGVGMSTISGPGTDWAFAIGSHNVEVGDWVRASGFYVIDTEGNRTPSGSIDINGDYQIDAVYGSYFTSASLRAEIGALAFVNASSFGSGTVLVDNK